MKKRSGISGAVMGLCVTLCFALVVLVHAQSQGNNPARKGAAMNHATGAFEIKMTPQKPDNFARMTSDKQWHGDLEGTSKGEMLAIVPDAKGSGVYVALERVTGTLKGRNGSFVLHHTGIMNRGAQELTILVVPDSGTDQLTGIAGKLMIHIAPDGKHSYDFEYTLPE